MVPVVLEKEISHPFSLSFLQWHFQGFSDHKSIGIDIKHLSLTFPSRSGWNKPILTGKNSSFQGFHAKLLKRIFVGRSPVPTARPFESVQYKTLRPFFCSRSSLREHVCFKLSRKYSARNSAWPSNSDSCFAGGPNSINLNYLAEW